MKYNITTHYKIFHYRYSKDHDTHFSMVATPERFLKRVIIELSDPGFIPRAWCPIRSSILIESYFPYKEYEFED